VPRSPDNEREARYRQAQLGRIWTMKVLECGSESLSPALRQGSVGGRDVFGSHAGGLTRIYRGDVALDAAIEDGLLKTERRSTSGNFGAFSTLTPWQRHRWRRAVHLGKRRRRLWHDDDPMAGHIGMTAKAGGLTEMCEHDHRHLGHPELPRHHHKAGARADAVRAVYKDIVVETEIADRARDLPCASGTTSGAS